METRKTVAIPVTVAITANMSWSTAPGPHRLCPSHLTAKRRCRQCCQTPDFIWGSWDAGKWSIQKYTSSKWRSYDFSPGNLNKLLENGVVILAAVEKLSCCSIQKTPWGVEAHSCPPTACACGSSVSGRKRERGGGWGGHSCVWDIHIPCPLATMGKETHRGPLTA